MQKDCPRYISHHLFFKTPQCSEFSLNPWCTFQICDNNSKNSKNFNSEITAIQKFKLIICTQTIKIHKDHKFLGLFWIYLQKNNVDFNLLTPGHVTLFFLKSSKTLIKNNRYFNYIYDIRRKIKKYVEHKTKGRITHILQLLRSKYRLKTSEIFRFHILFIINTYFDRNFAFLSNEAILLVLNQPCHSFSKNLIIFMENHFQDKRNVLYRKKVDLRILNRPFSFLGIQEGKNQFIFLNKRYKFADKLVNRMFYNNKQDIEKKLTNLEIFIIDKVRITALNYDISYFSFYQGIFTNKILLLFIHKSKNESIKNCKDLPNHLFCAIFFGIYQIFLQISFLNSQVHQKKKNHVSKKKVKSLKHRKQELESSKNDKIFHINVFKDGKKCLLNKKENFSSHINVRSTNFFSSFTKIIFVFMLLYVQTKDTCLPGSSLCKDNSMYICDVYGNFVVVDCPEKTSCAVKNGVLACFDNRELQDGSLVYGAQPVSQEDIFKSFGSSENIHNNKDNKSMENENGMKDHSQSLNKVNTDTQKNKPSDSHPLKKNEDTRQVRNDSNSPQNKKDTHNDKNQNGNKDMGHKSNDNNSMYHHGRKDDHQMPSEGDEVSNFEDSERSERGSLPTIIKKIIKVIPKRKDIKMVVLDMGNNEDSEDNESFLQDTHTQKESLSSGIPAKQQNKEKRNNIEPSTNHKNSEKHENEGNSFTDSSTKEKNHHEDSRIGQKRNIKSHSSGSSSNDNHQSGSDFHEIPHSGVNHENKDSYMPHPSKHEPQIVTVTQTLIKHVQPSEIRFEVDNGYQNAFPLKNSVVIPHHMPIRSGANYDQSILNAIHAEKNIDDLLNENYGPPSHTNGGAHNKAHNITSGNMGIPSGNASQFPVNSGTGGGPNGVYSQPSGGLKGGSPGGGGALSGGGSSGGAPSGNGSSGGALSGGGSSGGAPSGGGSSGSNNKISASTGQNNASMGSGGSSTNQKNASSGQNTPAQNSNNATNNVNEPTGGSNAAPSGSNSSQSGSSTPNADASQPGTPASSGSTGKDENQKAPSSNSDSNKPSSGEGGSISLEQLQQAITESGFEPPGDDVLNPIIEAINESFQDKNEASAFIAQTIHESGGFAHTSEIACKENNCEGSYQSATDIPGNFYYGRGYIQLTWSENYKQASEELGYGDDLLQNPNKVAEDPKIAIETAIWYWKKHVQPTNFLENNQFGLTTKAINGPLECGTGSETPAKRYDIYTKVAKIFGVENLLGPEGC